ncbi:MAG: LamG domain-containing protein [Candidatus Omnitrophica bacterium]|nr:LamG domain-containing protein [Candidatus Omnitrophota bacterium]
MKKWLLVELILSSLIFSRENPVVLYLPFDGDCKPAVRMETVEPKIQGNVLFETGLFGQGLVLGGKESAIVTYRKEGLFRADQGSVSFWVKAIDWEANEQNGFYFFRFLNEAFLYKYHTFEDTMSFYCKFPAYDRYVLYSAPLPLRKGKWFYLVVTWLDNVLQLYTNGERSGADFLLEPMRDGFHNQGLQFGYRYGEQHAVIDEFYVLDYPLSEAEVRTIYSGYQQDKKPLFLPAKPGRLTVVHYPGGKKVQVWLDLDESERANDLKRIDWWVVGENKKKYRLGQSAITENWRQLLFNLPKELPAGQVQVVAELIDPNGRVQLSVCSEPFDRRLYPWDGTQVGVSEEVIPPFTPLEVKGQELFCWGRKYRLENTGWPGSVVSQGKEILAKPITLEGQADGQGLYWSSDNLRLKKQSPGVVNWEGKSTSGHLVAYLDITAEYDGMLKYTLRLVPDRKVLVESLYLSIPVKSDQAILYHACRDGIRVTNESGYLPKGEGKVWGSSAKPSRVVLGTFLPYLWVGDYDRGFCWMADNDYGWSLRDNQDALEIFRQRGVVTLRINFFREPKKIDAPFETTFALMASPARPEPEGWRMEKTGLSWYCGQARTLQGYGKPPDWEAYLKDVEYYKKTLGYWGVNTSPNDFWGVTEENKYFQLEWSGGSTHGYPTEQRNDFVAWVVNDLMDKGFIDGLYSDDVYPQPTYNLITGRAYRRPDGKIQPGYSMFALRDFYKRLAYLFRKHKCSRGMLVHMTDSMIVPCYSFWDGKHDNEWGRTHNAISNYSLGEICARSMSRQYGMAASWHTESDWLTDPDDGGDELSCLLLLHDILGRADTMDDRTLPAKILFGFGEKDVEFLGYWLLQPDQDPEKKGVKISAWVRKEKKTALIVVANLSEDDWEGQLTVPLKLMGLPLTVVFCDGEENHPEISHQSGRITLAVPRHNYRLLLAGPKGVFPVNLPLAGTGLGKPARLIQQLSDTFDDKNLSEHWKLVSSPTANGRLGLYKNRLMVIGSDYRFAAAERPFGRDNVSIQVRVESRGHANPVGLALVWENGGYVFSGVVHQRKQFVYAAKAGTKKTVQWGPEMSLNNPGKMHQVNWLKITIQPEKILFTSSSDGKNWNQVWEMNRPEELKKAPAILRLGKSPTGEETSHNVRPSTVFFDDLLIGQES